MERIIGRNSLKDLIKGQEVARKYIGEPVKSIGRYDYYLSPFRENANSGTPFVVTDTYMVDNGGDFKRRNYSICGKVFQYYSKRGLQQSYDRL